MASEDFPAKYAKTEEAVTEKSTETQAALVDQFLQTYDKLDVAHHNVGYSSTTLFCKLVITQEDLEKNVPPALRTGIFEKPGTYDGVVRLNATTASAARMAIRINVPNDVGGPMLKEAAPSAYPDKFKQLDFLVAEELKEFIAETTQNLVNALSLRTKPTVKEILGALWNIGGVIDVAKGGKDARAPLDQTTGIVSKAYYGGLPFRAGANGAIKWAMLPKNEHKLPEDDTLSMEDPLGAAKILLKDLKTWMEEHKEEGAKFDFAIQIADNGEDGKNNDEFNIELGDAQWDEEKSPFVKVGTFIIPGDQEISIDTELNKYFHPEDTEETSKPEFNAVLFNPWNMLEAHKPLGPFNRARYEIYKACSKKRRGYGNKEEEPKLCPFLEMRK